MELTEDARRDYRRLSGLDPLYEGEFGGSPTKVGKDAQHKAKTQLDALQKRVAKLARELGSSDELNMHYVETQMKFIVGNLAGVAGHLGAPSEQVLIRAWKTLGPKGR